uniref:Fibrinogen C-terminal domain-containing protein n=1 Tax=Steinernema glaseri TaxID=37863 RepID=A0A1I7YD22_9BILA
MDDDYERNLAEAADAQKDLAFVETEVVRSNCFEYFKDDYLESGVYKMESPSGEVFFAACDMDTGAKGWTVMSRRINDFMFWNRTFEEYAVGFGNPGESHWLGLDRVHELVSHFPGGKALLRIELRNDLCSRRGACSGEGAEGYWWGEWKFAVDDRSKLFKLSVSSVLNGNLSTTAFDYFHSMNNNQPFTTVDRDNDRRASRNCAVFRNYGGWWHRDCGFMALNGKYGVTEGHSKGLYWLYQHKTKNALGTTVTYNVNPGAVAMLLRPL